MHRSVKHAIWIWGVFVICSCVSSLCGGQNPIAAPTPPEEKTEVPTDALGRDTPRGSVLGFLAAARKGTSVAALYLDTPLRGPDADELAHQLAVVLDARLPARLNELSDKPEGSIPDPLKPDRDLVGIISTAKGEFEIFVERVDRGKVGRVWLFSRETLRSIPDIYAELNSPPIERVLPRFLVKRVASVPVFQWLALFIGLPLIYLLTGILGTLIRLAIAAFRGQFLSKFQLSKQIVLPAPVRLLIVAVVVRSVLSGAGLPLLARQFWSTIALLITIVACTWLLMLLNSRVEKFVILRQPKLIASAAVLRLFRRVLDAMVLFAALLFTLYYFGVNPTAAFAGLGVGGIAIALAAQKTLENLIAGVSIIADRAVYVGDFLKVDNTMGTVEQVGLRSTRIRTLDRTLVCLPNGQISNMSLESFSARDKFWFHPVLRLRFDTSASQVRSILSDIRNLLLANSTVERTSVRVRFLAIAQSSLDIEIVAYLYASDWTQFLEVQEELLLSIIDIVEHNGAGIALPSQTMYISSDRTNTSVPNASQAEATI
jgi:MscS family membrane protein